MWCAGLRCWAARPGDGCRGCGPLDLNLSNHPPAHICALASIPGSCPPTRPLRSHAGAWLILEFDSRPDANAPAQFGNWASVYLSYLKSYEGMGTAQVVCVSGCECDKTVLDGTWEQQATLMQIHQFKVGPRRPALAAAGGAYAAGRQRPSLRRWWSRGCNTAAALAALPAGCAGNCRLRQPIAPRNQRWVEVPRLLVARRGARVGWRRTAAASSTGLTLAASSSARLGPQVTQHESCRIKVKVLKAPGAVKQAGHKVTLMAIMVSHYPLRLDTYDRTAEEFAAKLKGEDEDENPTPHYKTSTT